MLNSGYTYLKVLQTDGTLGAPEREVLRLHHLKPEPLKEQRCRRPARQGGRVPSRAPGRRGSGRWDVSRSAAGDGAGCAGPERLSCISS